MLSKRIATVIGVAALSLLWCSTATAQQTTVREVKACQKIGNIRGAGPVTCIDDGGTENARGVLTFRTGDDIYLLVRFRNLPLRDHRMLVVYQKADLRGRYSPVEVKAVTFSNDTRNWAQWFRSHHREVGKWRVSIVLQGRELGSVKYCVDCFGGD